MHGSKLSFDPYIFFLYDFIPLRFRNKYNSNREKMHGSKFSSVCIWAQDLIRRPASPSINIIDGDAGRRNKINLFCHLTLAFFSDMIWYFSVLRNNYNFHRNKYLVQNFHLTLAFILYWSWYPLYLVNMFLIWLRKMHGS